jgi:hypothetical protein
LIGICDYASYGGGHTEYHSGLRTVPAYLLPPFWEGAQGRRVQSLSLSQHLLQTLHVCILPNLPSPPRGVRDLQDQGSCPTEQVGYPNTETSYAGSTDRDMLT